MIATRSPARTRVTPAPTATTSPANSWPRICGFCAPVSGCGSTGVTIGPATYSCRSVPQMPQATVRTRTSPCPSVDGSGTSSMRRSRAAWKRRACIGESSGHDALGAQTLEQAHEQRLRVADAVEPEAAAAPHVGERLDRAPEVGVRVPPRGDRRHVEIAQPVPAHDPGPDLGGVGHLLLERCL